MKFEIYGCSGLSDSFDGRFNIFVCDKESVILRTSFCGNEDIDTHSNAPEVFHEPGEVREGMDILTRGSGICLNEDTSIAEIDNALNGLFIGAWSTAKVVMNGLDGGFETDLSSSQTSVVQ